MLVLKNLLRIVCNYKFHLLTIFFFELLYLIKGYRGNRIDFMSNDIPCSYYFLFKIKRNLTNINFHKFLDLGCGSGRVIDFFDKSFPNKNLVGIEYFSNQYEYCRKIFKKQKNIKIIQADFTKSDFFQYDADCYFLNNPFVSNTEYFASKPNIETILLKKNSELIEFIEKIINFSLKKKNILFIFVNYNKKIIEELKNIRCTESYYISDTKGYAIYCLNDN